MRIEIPSLTGERWFLTVFFRETGAPNPVQIGRSTMLFGRADRELAGRLAWTPTIEAIQEPGRIGLLPGSRIMSLIVTPGAPTQEALRRYAGTLAPGDEVELIKPSEVVVVDDLKLADEVAGDNDKIRRQLQVLKGNRRKFYG